ncbi:hypothetical protein [Microbacterium elymi]|uniref:Bacitracin resistance protein n=1 Tax=Microbacterium elymi TaxID=2909587 RepID=A0ABY5NJX6_9MICO|nr:MULTISPECIES: hypothetical protein [Microbacterium]UUT35464.1 hypothetical protein L2X98_18955 [Microbacterium elymi]
MTDATSAAPASGRRTPVWLLGTIVGLFGLFYAYAVWNAIGNLITSVQYFAGIHVPLNALGWFLWIFAAVLPVIVFVAGFRLAFRRAPGPVVLIMLSGLALVAVFWLNVVAYSVLNTNALIS